MPGWRLPGWGGGLSACATLALMAAFVGASPATAGARAGCVGDAATIVGTPGDDMITGTPHRDVINGLEGNARIEGRGGNDVICGGAGKDRIFPAGGDDFALGGPGR